jgi:hypothetical protein
MKQKFTSTFLFLLFITLNTFAQAPPMGHLTIFSEDGDKFYLVLNGEKINDVPQTNLRVEELTQPYYNAKIIFDDKAKAEISKNYLQIADVDGIFMDVTYKIKRDKNNANKMKLNFFSMTPVVHGFIAPANVYVTTFGRPSPSQGVHQNVGGSVTQTTTTTTNSGVLNAGMNVGGVGVNISIHDPNMETTITETTTTSSTVHQGNPNTYNGCVRGRAMSPNNFASALQTVKNQNFDDTRLKTAKQIADANCLNADQIVQMCQTFGFEESKLDFAKYAYGACVEPNNYFKLNNIFAFSSSVDELTKYIQGQ